MVIVVIGESLVSQHIVVCQLNFSTYRHFDCFFGFSKKTEQYEKVLVRMLKLW